MSVKLATSNQMTELGEHNILRFAQNGRDYYNITVGQHLNTKDRFGNSRCLKVCPSFLQDFVQDSTVGYVSIPTFEALNIGKDRLVDLNLCKNVTLGCDPEFFLVDKVQNKLVSATQIFLRKNGDVGFDGIMAEVRPAPSLDEHQVCYNIWELIKKARRAINNRYPDPQNVELTATSFLVLPRSTHGGVSAGFHLHYGLPKPIIGTVNDRHPIHHIAKQIIRVLDYYVGMLSTIAENNTESGRRSCIPNPYGKPGDFRMDNLTLEYRTPGGTMLKHPVLTAGLLGVGALVVDDIILKLEDWTDSFTKIDRMVHADIRDCYPNIPKDQSQIFGMMCSPSNDWARTHLETIANDLVNMPGFDRRKIAVENLLTSLTNRTNFSSNMEENWKEFYNEDSEEQVELLP